MSYPDNITAPITDNETWQECRRCGAVERIVAVPGLLHRYVDRCRQCPPAKDDGRVP